MMLHLEKFSHANCQPTCTESKRPTQMRSYTCTENKELSEEVGLEMRRQSLNFVQPRVSPPC